MATEHNIQDRAEPFGAGRQGRIRLLRRAAPVALGVVGLMAVAALAAGATQGAAPHPGPQIRPVQTLRIADTPATVVRSYTGIVQARVETDMGFRVPGKIAKRLVQVGDTVTAGQVLAELDPADLTLAAEAAEAQARAAAAAAAQATADEARYRALRAKGHVSDAEYDRRRAAADSTRQQQLAAERQRDLARNRLDHASLRADADGVVTAVTAEVGQVVAEGRPVLRLARSGAVEAVVSIPEARLADARAVGATVSFWADPGRKVPATLRELSPDADSVTRGYTARFTLDSGPDTVPALGMTATVHLPATDAAAGIRLPRSAVVDLGKGHQVWAVDAEGRLTAVPVTIVGQTQDSLTVRGALPAGLQIVAMGAHRLDGSEAVRVIEVRS